MTVHRLCRGAVTIATNASRPHTRDTLMLSTDQLLQLKRWNTPTIYNGWEQITRHDPGHDGFNLEETRDFMPQMGPMVGYAVTVVVEPGNPSHRKTNPDAGARW